MAINSMEPLQICNHSLSKTFSSSLISHSLGRWLVPRLHWSPSTRFQDSDARRPRAGLATLTFPVFFFKVVTTNAARLRVSLEVLQRFHAAGLDKIAVDSA